MSRVLVLVFALAGVAAARAEVVERIVWADVIAVEPVTEPIDARLPASCAAPRPVDVSLADLLAWDLRPECVEPAARERVLGYRVRYTWDGRTYVRQVDERPGRRLPLLVKFTLEPGRLEAAR